MVYNFCTLFDKNYIFRGLAMYFSLKEHCPNFKLWILCMDNDVYSVLQKLNLDRAVLIRLSVIERDLTELIKIKPKRTTVEYCWTLSSVLTWYILKNNPLLPYLTYLDSDIYFYGSPASLFEEIGDKSVAIVRHNYEDKLKYQEKRSGIYNVSWVTFKNNAKGMDSLEWWKNACLNWCYNRHEDGKFGDQKYLDDWPTRFEGVCVIQHIGANVAPWNINRYKLLEIDGKIMLDEQKLIFYHFHSFKMFSDGKFMPHSLFYNFSKNVYNWLYQPYFCEIQKCVDLVKTVDFDFGYGFDKKPSLINLSNQIIKRYFIRIFHLSI
jgi:hypothetical protein